MTEGLDERMKLETLAVETVGANVIGYPFGKQAACAGCGAKLALDPPADGGGADFDIETWEQVEGGPISGGIDDRKTADFDAANDLLPTRFEIYDETWR